MSDIREQSGAETADLSPAERELRVALNVILPFLTALRGEVTKKQGEVTKKQVDVFHGEYHGELLRYFGFLLARLGLTDLENQLKSGVAESKFLQIEGDNATGNIIEKNNALLFQGLYDFIKDNHSLDQINPESVNKFKRLGISKDAWELLTHFIYYDK